MFTGTQRWECGSNGEFIGEIPDRSDCSEAWLPDFENEINNNDTTSTENSDLLDDKLNETESGVSGGALKNLTDLLDELLQKRQREINNGNVSLDDQLVFYLSFMRNIDTLISFDKSWRDLNLTQFDGPEINTKYIQNVNDLGQIYLNDNDITCKNYLQKLP